jgi:protein TonB
MGGRLTRLAPLAASLLGHAAVIAAVAAAGLLGGAAPVPVVAVRRAPDPAPPPRLQLTSADGDAGGLSGDAAVPLDTPDPRYRDYLSAVKRRIWERWDGAGIPPETRARGTLVVEFTLTRGGRLAGSGLLEPSGTPALDREALAAVARATPFAPLPSSIGGDTLRIRARFTYD